MPSPTSHIPAGNGAKACAPATGFSETASEDIARGPLVAPTPTTRRCSPLPCPARRPGVPGSACSSRCDGSGEAWKRRHRGYVGRSQSAPRNSKPDWAATLLPRSGHRVTCLQARLQEHPGEGGIGPRSGGQQISMGPSGWAAWGTMPPGHSWCCPKREKGDAAYRDELPPVRPTMKHSRLPCSMRQA